MYIFEHIQGQSLYIMLCFNMIMWFVTRKLRATISPLVPHATLVAGGHSQPPFCSARWMPCGMGRLHFCSSVFCCFPQSEINVTQMESICLLSVHGKNKTKTTPNKQKKIKTNKTKPRNKETKLKNNNKNPHNNYHGFDWWQEWPGGRAFPQC